MEDVKALAAIADFVKSILEKTFHLLFLGLLCLWLGKGIKWVEIIGLVLIVLAIANICQHQVQQSRANKRFLLELNSASLPEKAIFRQMVENNSNIFNSNTLELIEGNLNATEIINNATVIPGLARFGQVLLGVNQQFTMFTHYWELLLKHRREILGE